MPSRATCVSMGSTLSVTKLPPPLLEQLKEPCGCGATVITRSMMDRGRPEGGGRCMFVGAAVISSFVLIVSCVFVSFLC